MVVVLFPDTLLESAGGTLKILLIGNRTTLQFQHSSCVCARCCVSKVSTVRMCNSENNDLTNKEAAYTLCNVVYFQGLKHFPSGMT